MGFHPYYRPNEFSLYDIACAASVLLPISVVSGAIAAGLVWLPGGLP